MKDKIVAPLTCEEWRTRMFRETDERAEVEAMIRRHAHYTKNKGTWKILASWEDYVPKFVKVTFKDYHRMLDAIRRAEAVRRRSWKHLKQTKTTWRASAGISWYGRASRYEARCFFRPR